MLPCLKAGIHQVRHPKQDFVLPETQQGVSQGAILGPKHISIVVFKQREDKGRFMCVLRATDFTHDKT